MAGSHQLAIRALERQVSDAGFFAGREKGRACLRRPDGLPLRIPLGRDVQVQVRIS